MTQQQPHQQPASQAHQATPAQVGNPWIGVRFTCAGKYVRVFRRPDAPAYIARCPTCAKCVRFRVGKGGSDARMFEVSC